MTTQHFTPTSPSPYTYACPDCEGHGQHGDPWRHPLDPAAEARDCALCGGTGEIDYRKLDDDVFDGIAFGGRALDDRALAIARLICAEAEAAWDAAHPVAEVAA